jgi:23S rRNA (adenine2503-C2)-methyltransferase
MEIPFAFPRRPAAGWDAVFCASAAGGLQRNLTPGEMADQILSIEEDTGEEIGNIVVMGTGEPLDNYENLSRFIQNIHEKDGLNIGMRSITVSTCGLIPKMADLARDFPQVNLAVSLHASNDAVRGKLMPIARRYSMDELLAACANHIALTGRRITFEYTMIKGVNDSDNCAEELAQRLHGLNSHVNLIPLNRVAGIDLPVRRKTVWNGSADPGKTRNSCYRQTGAWRRHRCCLRPAETF